MILNSNAVTHKSFCYVTKLSIKVCFPWEHGAHICKLFTLDFKFHFVSLMDIFPQSHLFAISSESWRPRRTWRARFALIAS